MEMWRESRETAVAFKGKIPPLSVQPTGANKRNQRGAELRLQRSPAIAQQKA
jgi:hypothetical protein